MKIAQIAPLIEAVPPKFYGGTERVVHYLTEALVDMGHEVTLFASGDSKTSARLIATAEACLRQTNLLGAAAAYQVIQLKEVMTLSHEFDLLHFHTDFLHFPWLSETAIPHLTTLHGRQDLPGIKQFYGKFPEQNLVSISNNQRIPILEAHWLKTVYHGLPIHLHKKGEGQGDYLAFLGRISPEKGIEQAITIAVTAGIPLKIAAKIDPLERDYYQSRIKDLLRHPLIEFIGEISEAEKTDFLGSAMGLLFPIDWEEPFGMVLIEAMSCGTPVIAFNRGSVPEILEQAVDGYIVEDIPEALRALEALAKLDRARIRQNFERRFTSEIMASNYVCAYKESITKASPAHIKRLLPPQAKDKWTTISANL